MVLWNVIRIAELEASNNTWNVFEYCLNPLLIKQLIDNFNLVFGLNFILR